MVRQATALAHAETSLPLGVTGHPLETAVNRAKQTLLAQQHKDGYWVYELEADCTIPAEYILMMHYLGEVNEILQAKICHYLRSRQNADGGYPLFTGGAGDMSCSVKVYFALKLAGDSIDAPHMRKLREWILEHGGAAKSNVFTRIMLAIFEQVPWRAVPFLPVEVMLLPRWFPFHLDKVSYWSRTVMVPLFILCSAKVKARNPKNVNIRELFTVAPECEKNYFSHVKTPLGKVILGLERFGSALEPFIPKFIRRRATEKAHAWFLERLNGEDGLGAIFPAMVNAYEALLLLNKPEDAERIKTARAAIDKLLVIDGDIAYCQPCVSPIWDTGLASLALQEVARHENDPFLDAALHQAMEWLASKQLRDEPGDWQVQRPELPGGGWAFQFGNSYYPDVDDTAVVGIAMQQADNPQWNENIERAADWIAGMQSKNGGYGAFDADNTSYYLNHVPFADHGALLDPPTADVSGRCAMFLAGSLAQKPEYRSVIDRCVDYLRSEQEVDGSWFGRWGTNYIYGTWSVLVGFERVGIPKDDLSVRRAVKWLLGVQRPDGGWGEDNYTYHDASEALRGRNKSSSAFHTAIALLALMAAGEIENPAVQRGVDFLLASQRADGLWEDKYFNAPGFPKVFYLKYHGYARFFPLWALARYRNETLWGA